MRSLFFIILLSLFCISALVAGSPQKTDLSVRMFYPGAQSFFGAFVEPPTLVFKELRIGPQTVFELGLRPMYRKDEIYFRLPQNMRFHGVWFTVSFLF